MPRPPLEPGTWGSVWVSRNPNGTYTARCRYRSGAEPPRHLERNGRSPAQARARLNRAAFKATTPDALDITVFELASQWVDTLERSSNARPQSIQAYRGVIKRRLATTDFGSTPVDQVTTLSAETALQQHVTTNRAESRLLRSIVKRAFAAQVRFGRLPSNPIAGTTPILNSTPPLTTLTLDQLAELRLRVARWQAGIDPPRVREQGGEKRAQDMLTFIDLMLATGCRVGELVALRWSDIDLTADPVTATICGTAVPLTGGGLVRQDYTKTRSGRRTIAIPRFAQTTLLDLRVDAISPWVFASEAGTMRSPNNLNRQWRDARGPDFAWVTGHVFRRTSATLIEQYGSLSAASKQLGHSSTQVTERHYVRPPERAPDSTAILELFRDPDRY